jgi:hypothetical protein
MHRGVAVKTRTQTRHDQLRQFPETHVMTNQYVLPPDTSLRRKAGGPIGQKLGDAALTDVERAVEIAAERIKPQVLETLELLQSLVRAERLPGIVRIYELSHTIRGLAGTCGLNELGEAAAIMCTLLDGQADDAPIDPNLLTSLAVTMKHATHPSADKAMLAELLQACREAVATNMAA